MRRSGILICLCRFVVRDASQTSEWRMQPFGISQGCPLSPYLFVLMMTILMHDAKRKSMDNHDTNVGMGIMIDELVYADDTLLIGVNPDQLQAFMTNIGEAGLEYGLSFNWSKLEMLPIRTEATIQKPNGTAIDTKNRMVYLGSMLADDGRISSELNRRLGMARSDFEKLRLVWSHSTLSSKRKIKIFGACVITKLLYGLQTACLNQAERRRLDGFHARCCRTMLKIPSAYYSRVSNEIVFKRAATKRLSARLLQFQLHYFWTLAQRPDDDPVRRCVFQAGSIETVALPTPRRQGRPRLEWATEIGKHAAHAVGSREGLIALMTNGAGRRDHWKQIVKRYVT